MNQRSISRAVLRNLAAASVCAIAMSSEAVTISLSPPGQNVEQGDTFEVLLEISGLGNGTAPSLGAFDLMLGFNPAIVGYDSATFGDMLGPVNGSFTDAIPDSLNGSVNLFGISLDTAGDLDQLQAGGFVLATLRFNAIGPGITSLELSSVIVGDANGDPLAADISGARITVADGNPVPDGETSGFGLMALAVVFAGFSAIKRNLPL